jgi:hypothetical protein
MKSMNMKDLNDFIAQKNNEVEQKMLRAQPPGKRHRAGPRDPEEVTILDRLSQKKWKEAETAGKVKYLSERVWYYEFD